MANLRSLAPAALVRFAAVLGLCAFAFSAFGQGDPRMRIQGNVGGRDAPVPKGGYADDEVFGVTQGGDLDNYLFRRDRPGGLRFTVPIDRAFLGYQTSPRDLAQIIVNAKFVMSVYDVDQDGSPCPEVDVVTINGYPIPDKPTLSGSNNGWSTYSWNIPSEWFVSGKIRLGQLSLLGGPYAGDNEIRIDIDTQCGDTWAVQVDWGAFYIRAVRPIVFVHGMRDSPQSWRTVAGRPGMASWVPGQILHFSRAGGYTGIHENAPDVRTAIEAAKERYGVDEVNVVCHSRGGLDAFEAVRATPDDVQNLVTLASPLQGSQASDRIVLWLLANPNWRWWIDQLFGSQLAWDLSTWGRSEYYNGVGRRAPSGINFKSFGGTAFSSRQLGPRWSSFPFSSIASRTGIAPGTFPVRHDGLVAIDRAMHPWMGGVNGSFALGHHSLDSNPSMINSRGAFDALWAVLVETARQSAYLKVNSGPGPGSSMASRAPIQAAVTANPPLAALPLELGALAANGSRTFSLPIDRTVARFESYATVEAGEDAVVQAIVKDPLGRTMRHGSGGFELVTEHRPDGSVMIAFAVQRPASGVWTLTLSSSLAGIARLATILDSPLAISAEVGAATIDRGDTVTISANDLSSGTLQVSAESRIRDRSGNLVATVPMQRSGGRWLGAYHAAEGGEFTAEVVQAAGVLSRSGVASFLVRPRTGQIGPIASQGIDTDGNSLFDELMAQVELQIATPGEFRLTGVLEAMDGTVLGNAEARASLEPGTRRLDLAFNGRTIRNAGIDGPYRLTHLQLIDDTPGVRMETDSVESAHETSAYLSGQFEGPVISLHRPAREEARDTNGNGQYDLLDVSVDVDLAPGAVGSYGFNAELRDRSGRSIAFSEHREQRLEAGRNTLLLRFRGASIGAADAQGPYSVTALFVYARQSSVQLIEDDVLVTRAYDPGDFEGGLLMPQVAAREPLMSSVRGTLVFTLPRATPTAATFSLSSNDPAALPLPGQVTFAAGSRQIELSVQPGALRAPQVVVISVRSGSRERTFELPIGLSAAEVESVRATPPTIKSGDSTRVLVTLKEPAPAGGAVVTLSQNSRSAAGPSQLVIPAGRRTGVAVFRAHRVGSVTRVDVTVQTARGSKQTSFWIEP